MSKLYELLENGDIPAPSFGLDFERMGTNKIADVMVRGKHSRNSDKWTLNRHGILVKAEEDRISLDLKDGKMGYLAEPGATNLLLNSRFNGAVSGTPGTQPDEWILFRDNGSFEVIPESVGNSLIIEAADERQVIEQFVPVDPGEYVYSVEIEILSNDGTSINGMVLSTTTSFNYYVNGESVNGTLVLSPGKYLIELKASVSESHSARLRLGVGAASNDTAEVRFFSPQFETGNVRTSYIPTEGSTAPRGADNLIFEDAEDMIGQQSGAVLLNLAWFTEGVGGVSDSITGFKITPINSQSNRGITVGIRNTGDLMFNSRNSNGNTIDVIKSDYELGEYIKILFSWDIDNYQPDTTSPDSLKVFINGEKIDEFDMRIPPELFGAIRFIGGQNSASQIVPTSYKQAYTWNNADWLTDELAEELTT